MNRFVLVLVASLSLVLFGCLGGELPPEQITTDNIVQVVQSGQAFECEFTSTTYDWSSTFIGKNGVVRRTEHISRNANRDKESNLIYDNNEKKVYSEITAEHSCDWYYYTFKPYTKLEGLVENLKAIGTGVLTCRKPSFSEEDLKKTWGAVCSEEEYTKENLAEWEAAMNAAGLSD
jgi:hypothetical protein